MLFTLKWVVLDQVTQFQGNFLHLDTLFFLLQVIMMNLRLRQDFIHKSLGLEDFHNRFNSPILGQQMDLILRIQDHFRLSGDLLKISMQSHQVERWCGLYLKLLLLEEWFWMEIQISSQTVNIQVEDLWLTLSSMENFPPVLNNNGCSETIILKHINRVEVGISFSSVTTTLQHKIAKVKGEIISPQLMQPQESLKNLTLPKALSIIQSLI